VGVKDRRQVSLAVVSLQELIDRGAPGAHQGQRAVAFQVWATAGRVTQVQAECMDDGTLLAGGWLGC
jgi:hypothetical protein